MKNIVFRKFIICTNWLCWFYAKLLIINRKYWEGISLEAISRMLGCQHQVFSVRLPCAVKILDIKKCLCAGIFDDLSLVDLMGCYSNLSILNQLEEAVNKISA